MGSPPAAAPPSRQLIDEAATLLAEVLPRTPVLTCGQLDALTGARLYLKAECFQKTGSFKVRGATFAVSQLDGPTAARGVATHSSGNHGAALAFAAQRRGIPCTVVVPEGAPGVKVAAMQAYGARLIRCEANLPAREAGLAAVVAHNGATVIPPYNHPHVIAGQSTLAREFLAQTPGLDAVVVPVGGGGLLSGTCLSVAALNPHLEILGAEPQSHDDAHQSLQRGAVVSSLGMMTMADGLRVALGSITFPIIRQNVRQILTVTESEIAAAMRLLFERAKVVVEASGAVGLAVVLRYREQFAGRRVGLILSGGNVDLDDLPFSSP